MSKDYPERVNQDLRAASEKLRHVAVRLHTHASRLELAVEGNYATQLSDPRVQLLSEALDVARGADVELSRIGQIVQRAVEASQEDSSWVTINTFLASSRSQPDLSSDVSSEEREMLTSSISTLTNNLGSLRQERDELQTLYEVARTLNSQSNDIGKVLRSVMDQVIEVVRAERGFLMLANRESGDLEFTIARNRQRQIIGESAFKISHSTVKNVRNSLKPVLIDNRLTGATEGQESMVAFGIYSIMCAPLIARDKFIGIVYVDSLSNTSEFDKNHLDLLEAFCNQAAIAIDNAYLFAELSTVLRQVNEDKQYMHNIFSSIANGVMTTDDKGIVKTFNIAASMILRLKSEEVIGQHYRDVFRHLPQLGLSERIQYVQLQHEHGTIVPYSVDCQIAGRGEINLTCYVSALRDNKNVYMGTVLVIDDRTELKRSAAQVKEIRRIFGRYVHPHVVQQLIEDPRAINLGGETKEISVVFADIRGFTSLSERSTPEQIMVLLNEYLGIMVRELWTEEGTVTAFMGDALMAIFNAPLPQGDHALRAVRAAWKMRQAVLRHWRSFPLWEPITFGFGVNTGLGVVGNLGSKDYIQNYTAIGDAVNVASRLQSNASDNNILLNHTTFMQVRRNVNVLKMPPLKVKGKQDALDVWQLTGIV